MYVRLMLDKYLICSVIVAFYFYEPAPLIFKLASWSYSTLSVSTFETFDVSKTDDGDVDGQTDILVLILNAAFIGCPTDMMSKNRKLNTFHGKKYYI